MIEVKIAWHGSRCRTFVHFQACFLNIGKIHFGCSSKMFPPFFCLNWGNLNSQRGNNSVKQGRNVFPKPADENIPRKIILLGFFFLHDKSNLYHISQKCFWNKSAKFCLILRLYRSFSVLWKIKLARAHLKYFQYRAQRALSDAQFCASFKRLKNYSLFQTNLAENISDAFSPYFLMSARAKTK